MAGRKVPVAALGGSVARTSHHHGLLMETSSPVSLRKPATHLRRSSLVASAAAASAGAIALLLLAIAAIGDAAGFDVVSPIFWGAYAVDASLVAVGGGVLGVLLGSAATAGRHVVWSVAAMVAGSLVWLVGIEWPFGLGS